MKWVKIRYDLDKDYVWDRHRLDIKQYTLYLKQKHCRCSCSSSSSHVVRGTFPSKAPTLDSFTCLCWTRSRFCSSHICWKWTKKKARSRGRHGRETHQRTSNERHGAVDGRAANHRRLSGWKSAGDTTMEAIEWCAHGRTHRFGLTVFSCAEKPHTHTY